MNKQKLKYYLLAIPYLLLMLFSLLYFSIREKLKGIVYRIKQALGKN